jgi:hypothetical protein
MEKSQENLLLNWISKKNLDDNKMQKLSQTAIQLYNEY